MSAKDIRSHPASETETLKRHQPRSSVQVDPSREAVSLCNSLADGVRDFRPSSVLPILGWFPKFMAHSPLRSMMSDISVGITVAAVVVPQGMAYGMLASLPPVHGLYTAILPPLVYTLFGSCMHLAVGPFALIAMLTAAGIADVVPNPQQNPEAAIAAAAVISALSGLVLLGLGVLRLGFIATFLSDSVLSGYTTAVSIIIPTSQMKYAFQLQVSGRGGFIDNVQQLATGVAAGRTNYLSFAIFMVSIGTIVILQKINTSGKFKILKKFPLPAELIVVVIFTVMSGLLSLKSKHGVDVMGEIPSGMPVIKMPELSRFNLNDLLSSVLIVSLMTYITAMSVSKTFARKFGYEVDNNQELIALGVANLLASVSSSFPPAASLSRTAIVGTSGAASPMHNVWTVVILVLILLYCGPALQNLPLSALAAVVVAAFKSLLLNGITEFNMSRRVSLSDFLVWNIAFWSTLITSVTVGIGIAVMANLMFLFWKSTRPSHVVLGRLAGTERLYRNRRLFDHAEVIQGVMLFRFDGPLHFANRDAFSTSLMRNLLQHDAELSGTPFDEKATFWGGVRKLGGALVTTTICSDSTFDAEEAVQARKVEAVVIDFSPVVHIDISAVRALDKLRGELLARGTRLVIAHCKFDVHEKLSNMGLFNDFEPTGTFNVVCFRELHDAVLFAEGRLELAIEEETQHEAEAEAAAPETRSTSGDDEAPGQQRQATRKFSGLAPRPKTVLTADDVLPYAMGANELGPLEQTEEELNFSGL